MLTLFCSSARRELGKRVGHFRTKLRFEPLESRRLLAASAWATEMVDSTPTGWLYALDHDPLGNAAIGYHDDANQLVKFANWNGISWDIETVDNSGNGSVELAYDPVSGNPTLAYNSSDGLTFARGSWNESENSWDWNAELIDGKLRN